jgi:hypothetical protein
MMILPPIEPMIRLLDKGAMRKLFLFLSKEIGVSNKTIESIHSHGKIPSPRTIQKFMNCFIALGVERPKKLLNIRKIARRNEWGALLDGIELVGLPDDIFVHLRKEIHKLAKLDEKLEFHHKNSHSLNDILLNSHISWIVEAEGIHLDEGLDKKEIYAKLFGLRIKVSLYLIACFESELHRISGDGRPPEYVKFLDFGVYPRKIFLEDYRESLKIKSINKMAEIISDNSGQAIEECKRMVFRIYSGKHSVSLKSLTLIKDLDRNESQNLFYMDYWFSEFFSMLRDIILYGESEGGINTSFKCSLKDDYIQYLYHWETWRP